MCQHQQHPEAPASSQHTPLGAQGLYIQTLLPGSPAASDGRLSLGDRILEVNGSSLIGVSYMRYTPHLARDTGPAREVTGTCRPALHPGGGEAVAGAAAAAPSAASPVSFLQSGGSDPTWRQEDAISRCQV